MRVRDLRIGDRVWVVLPYDGGRGYATIVSIEESGMVGVAFDAGQTARSEDARLVRPRWIVRKEVP